MWNPFKSIPLPEGVGDVEDRIIANSPVPFKTEPSEFFGVPGAIGGYSPQDRSISINQDWQTAIRNNYEKAVRLAEPDLIRSATDKLNRRASVYAHEIGHHEWDQHPVGSLLQTAPFAVARTKLPWLAAGASGFAPKSRLGRGLGVALSSAWAAAPLLNEYMADHYGHKILTHHGATPGQMDAWRTGRAGNLRYYIHNLAATAGIGATAFGSRELYDWYQRRKARQLDQEATPPLALPA
jgi:hypothetical protein